MNIRVRYAPSPTGPQHIGGARSALFNYLLARKHNGTFIVRSEDTDLERSSPVWEQNIFEALRWLGIEWNEGLEVGGEFGPYRQTERLALYREYTERLIREGKAYYCFCTEEEAEKERQEQLARGETPHYAGRCRNLTAAEHAALIAAGRRPVVRFKVPAGQQILVSDLVRGDVVFDSDGIGDFIIVKSDGIPVYNFAVVIDDITMRITHVIRGEEHLSNTPRQILLYEALGAPKPQFAHISLILNTEGHKMSKRDGDTAVLDYRDKGYLPEAVVNFIALLGWAPPGEQEYLTMDELVENFSLERVSKSPAVFDLNKLNWINAKYIRQAAPERLAELCFPYLREAGVFPAEGEISAAQRQWVIDFVRAVADKLSYLAEIKDYIPYVSGTEFPAPTGEAAGILQGQEVSLVLDVFRQKLLAAEELSVESVKTLLKQLTKELKLPPKLVYMPLRVALTGQMHGPELYSIIPLLGKENVLARLERN